MILFISLNPRDYSRTATILNSSEFSQARFEQIGSDIKSIVKISKLVRQQRINTIVVASPSHILVPFFRVLTNAKIILDAGWPLSDSNFTRSKNFHFLISAAKNRVVDFFAFQMADIVMLESQLQKEKFSSKNCMDSKKFHVSYTGVDETKFTDSKIDKNFITSLGLPSGNKTVLFRAKVNQEAGYEFLEKVSTLLPEDINLVICSGGQELNYQFSRNVRTIETWLSATQLRTLYLQSDLILGQLSNHNRLARTIPHKVYEAAYFGKALVTFENLGVMELLNKSEAIFLNPSSPEDFAAKISSLLEHPDELKGYGNRIFEKYITLFSQEKIANNFLDIVNGCNDHSNRSIK